jgi:hypothetical protein
MEIAVLLVLKAIFYYEDFSDEHIQWLVRKPTARSVIQINIARSD